MSSKYIVLTTSDRHQLHVSKATTATPANADWDSQDSANSPNFQLGDAHAIESYWAFEDGTNIHIATQLQVGHVHYHVFSKSSDTWTTVEELVEFIGETNFDLTPVEPAVSLALRSDGDVILCAAYAVGTTDRIRVFSRQGSTWANEGAASEDTAAKDYHGVTVVGPDSSDRISWVIKNHTDFDIDLASIAWTTLFQVNKNLTQQVTTH